jgi:glycine cleavage system H lipoate-binding protein
MARQRSRREKTADPLRGGVMSILFALLMFLLIVTISYFREGEGYPVTAHPSKPLRKPLAPVMAKESGFAVPQGYAFHPGHTWVAKDTGESARVGVDQIAADLFGKIDSIDVIGLNRWVRQGQRFLTIHSGEEAIDLLSPIEGMITAVNGEALKDCALVSQDPYKNGWIAMVKSPDLAVNEKNLMRGAMVAPWMQYSLNKLKTELTQASPALAQDGGLPVKGLLRQLPADLRKRVIGEMFLA